MLECMCWCNYDRNLSVFYVGLNPERWANISNFFTAGCILPASATASSSLDTASARCSTRRPASARDLRWRVPYPLASS